MKMPIITDELGMSLSADLGSRGRLGLLRDIFEIIQDENPLFFKQLQVVASITLNEASLEDQKYMEGVLEGMGLMYQIIRSQMEADEMNEVWGGGEKE